MSLNNPPKIILITGGDINNVDKGIVPASIGVLLQANGYNVTIIKMDPCLNRDSAQLDPFKYGEKYTLDDGEVASVNFGNYEKILDQVFTKNNNITRGKIDDYVQRLYHNEIKYNGDKIRTVRLIDATVHWIKKIFFQPINENGILPDICIIELSGNDDEISDKVFMKALSEFKYFKNNFMHIHVSKFLDGKFDFLEKSVQNLRLHDWKPDVIVCRSENPINELYKKYISKYASTKTKMDEIINIPKVSNIKNIPIILHEQNVYNLIACKLNLKYGQDFEAKMSKLKEEVKKTDNYKNVVKIALVGKYFLHPYTNALFEDSYESVIQALKIAAAYLCCKVEIIYVLSEDLANVDINIRNAAYSMMDEADGILIPGAVGEESFKGMIKACKYARENRKPCLSLCYGFQAAIIEFCLNDLGIKDAWPYQKILDEKFENGNIRRGSRTVTFLTKDSMLYNLYGKKAYINERNVNRDEIKPDIIPPLLQAGIRFVGVGFDEDGNNHYLPSTQNLVNIARLNNEDREEDYIATVENLCKFSRENDIPLRMQVMELTGHPYYVGVQYKPRFGARPSLPSPPYIGLIEASLRFKEENVSKNYYCSLM